MNISFSEIFLILLIAFLVIKPERLPEVAQVLGKWIGTMRRIIFRIKDELNNPLAKPITKDDT